MVCYFYTSGSNIFIFVLVLVDNGQRSSSSMVPLSWNRRIFSWSRWQCQIERRCSVVGSMVWWLFEKKNFLCTSRWLRFVSNLQMCPLRSYMVLLLVTTSYTSIMSPSLSCQPQLSCLAWPVCLRNLIFLKPSTSFIALLCTFARHSIDLSRFKYGDQAWIAYSMCGLTNVLSINTKDSVSRSLNCRCIIPKTLRASVFCYFCYYADCECARKSQKHFHSNVRFDWW